MHSTVEFSDIQGLNHFNISGSGNIGNNSSDNPLFSNADNNLRLTGGSPCANTGSNSLVPGHSGSGITNGDPGDLDYNTTTAEELPCDRSLAARIANTTVDMGAYELPRVRLDVGYIAGM